MSDDKPVNDPDNGDGLEGGSSQGDSVNPANESEPAAAPDEPRRFWGSTTPSAPANPSDFGASSNAEPSEPADTTPSWIQQTASSQEPPQPPVSPPTPPTPPLASDWQNVMPPPSAPEQPGNHFGDVPTFQPPTAHGGKRKVELRPYTVADILDLTFQLMKSNWKKLAIATLVFALPAGIISAISDAARNVGGSGSEIFFGNSFSFYGRFGADSSLSGGRLAIVGICGVLSLLISLLLQPLVQGAITRLVAANFVGRDMGPKEAFDGVKSMWLTFVGASILVPLATLGGLLGLIVGALAVWVLFTAVIPIIAIEEEGVFNAMGRSWALMKRGFWRYLGTLLALFVVRFLISIAVILIPGGIALILYSANLDAVAVVFGAAAAVLSSLVVFPIAAIAATLIYFDARVRFEGFDVQLMAARLPQSSAPTYGSGNL